jgi:tripartite-type tricarboxylate transporter receptor subunit TctC
MRKRKVCAQIHASRTALKRSVAPLVMREGNTDMLRHLALFAFVGALLMGLPNGGAAQNVWPTRSVKIIVPFAAGGPADNYARVIAQHLQEVLGQAFVVDDKPGAGSVIGTEVAARAVPDGYTLLLMSNAHTVNETLIPGKPFMLMRDFVAVAPINYSDLVLVANPGLPDLTLKELIQHAKAQPGTINYASSGQGTPYHMAAELFKSMAGVHLVHIPYRGSSGARTDVMGGQVELMFDAVSTMVEQVRAGKVRALATTGLQRSLVLPDVPTVDEAGVPGYEATIWLGLMAPKGTSKAVLERLNQAVSRTVNLPEVQQLWAKQGAMPMVMSPQVFDQYIRDDIAKWARVIQSAHIKVD